MQHNPRDSALSEVETLRQELQKAKLLLIHLENARAFSSAQDLAKSPYWYPLWRQVHDFLWGEAPAEDDDDIEFKGDWAENRLLTSDLV